MLSRKNLPTIILLLSVCNKVLSGGSSSVSKVVVTAFNQYVEKLKADKKVDNSNDSPEIRGYGGGGGSGHGGGGHGHGYGAITLDPVSIISLLALGAFLINNILQLLRANAPAPAAGGRKRSLDDVEIPESIDQLNSKSDGYNDKYFSSQSNQEPSFSKFFENVGSLYYLQPKKRNICIKKVVCRYVNAQKAREDGQDTFKTRAFDFMLSTITRFIAPELSSQTVRSDACEKFNRLCSDSLLQDAKTSVENKVYAEVSSLISTLAVKQLVG